MPVAARLHIITGGLLDVTEAAMGTRLLIRIAKLDGKDESSGVLSAGVRQLPGREEDRPEQVEHFGLTGEVAGFPADSQRLPKIITGLLVASGTQVKLPEMTQGLSFAVAIPDVPEPGDSPAQLAGSLRVLSLAQVGQREITADSARRSRGRSGCPPSAVARDGLGDGFPDVLGQVVQGNRDGRAGSAVGQLGAA
ncbi:MAG TPA: hypothetical protein VMR14_07795 [Streptosporangiaceae bacterium]|nr:hypothetical protein [Streptosporangiaceae bacterium]